ncbi:unnamed protein product [Absidia cylindrospora]
MNQVVEETLSEAHEALNDPYQFEHPLSRVAVIGAGPAGVATAKALLEQGFDIQVFERHTKVGGNWLFNEPTQDTIPIPTPTEKDGDWLQHDNDKMSAASGGDGCHLPSFVRSSTPVKCTDEVSHWLRNHHQPPSACYMDLNNNTASPVLGSYDFPWPKDTPYFIPHSKIQRYYEDYVDHFGLRKYIQFSTSLDAVEKRDDGKWHLTLTRAIKDDDGEHVSVTQYQSSFDALVIATGQYQDPIVPSMDGLHDFAARFPKKIMHSKQFARTDQFKNKNVLVVGGRVSAVDVSRLVSVGAKQVYLSYRGPFITNIFLADLVRTAIPDNVIHKPGVEGFWSKDANSGKTSVDGTITFTDGSTLDDIDFIVFATGYKSKHAYFGSSRLWISEDKDGAHFVPKENAPLVVMNDKKVHNTYKDIFLISDPTLAFAGAPRHITTTPFFDYQAHTIGRVWSQHAYLPSQTKMTTFSLKHTPPCAVYRMDYEAERLKPQILLPWLDLHAKQLVPDLHLPTLEIPSESLESVWIESVDIWKESIRRQQKELALAQ